MPPQNPFLFKGVKNFSHRAHFARMCLSMLFRLPPPSPPPQKKKTSYTKTGGKRNCCSKKMPLTEHNRETA